MSAKKILLPPKAGPDILERYGLFCEDRYDWSTLRYESILKQVRSGHAPLEAMRNGATVRLNVGSFNAEFREWSVDVISDYLRMAAQLTPAQTIVTHSAPRYWVEDAGVPCEVKPVGEYGYVVENFKIIARLAGELGLRLVVENNCTRWDEIPDDEEFDPERHLGRVRQYFCTYPEEWVQLVEDVNDPAFGLCMDTSHATNFAHRFPLHERPSVYHRFIDLAGDRLWHVHWNDNFVDKIEGRGDPHLSLGQGSVPRDVHERLWHQPSVTGYLLEHWYGEDALLDELKFIENL